MLFREALEYLTHFGYLDGWIKPLVALVPEWLAAEGLKRFQRAAGIPISGHLDADTVAEMDKPRCGCVDVLTISEPGELPAIWRKRSLTWKVRNYLPTGILAQSVQDDVFAEAFGGKGSWAEFLDLTFTRVGADAGADITVFASRIDGPGRVLAQAQLANGMDSPLWLQLDASEERWSTLQGSREANIEGVLEHELGHNLGFQHNPSSRALMYAYANSGIVDPQPEDIEVALRMGYSRRSVPVPPPVPPTPPTSGHVTLAFDGNATNFRLVP